MPMRVIVVQFSGSTCDRDLVYAMKDVMGWEVNLVWYKDAEKHLESYDAIFLPGGFTYGDHLRAGIIAAYTPVMEKVKELEEKVMRDYIYIKAITQGEIELDNFPYLWRKYH